MTALVTGGGGFLGRRVVELLLQRGEDVRFIARRRYPEVERLGARGSQVDLRDEASVRKAVEGCDTIFHVAARVGFWGPRAEYQTTNVGGTGHLLRAARTAGVRKLIYTSTPSVVGYETDFCGIDEAPYAAVHRSPYPESKAAAEQQVLAANGPDLATVALRPHLVFGPGDNHLLPTIVRNARIGRLRIVGRGENFADMTFIDNAAWAHLDAARALVDCNAACAGRAYFISNDEPVNMWDWTNDFLQRVGAPPVRRQLSLPAAMALGAATESIWQLLGLQRDPPMTRFIASALGRSHWYSMGPARRDLGYRIRVPMREATDRTVDWWLAQTERSPVARAG